MEFHDVNFESIFNSLKGLFLILKPDAPTFTIVTGNKAYLEATHITLEKACGKGLFEVFPDNPDDPTATGVKNLTHSLNTVLETKQPHVMAIQKYDVRLPESRGGTFEERYWSPMNTPVLDMQGNIQYIIHQVTDVTHEELLKKDSQQVISARKEAENQLVQEKNKLELLVENLPVGVFIVKAPSGEPMLINKVGKQLLGRDISTNTTKVNYTHFYQTVRDDGTPFPNNELPLVQAMESGEPVLNKTGINAKRPDGSIMSLRVSAVPLKDENGDIISAMAVFEDITKEKEVDRMKTEFISLSSHQLRTPLTAMKWFLELLLAGDTGPLTKEQREYLTNVELSNERMINLVNSLLNVSRIESGRIIVDPVPTRLDELVQEVVTDLKAKIEERHQNIVVTVEDNLPLINVDRKLIRQVYLNLLTNAVKYSPKKSKIKVHISKKEDAVVSEVADKGFGIPKEDHKKVFSKFYRGGNAIKLDTDGNGLGMYLVKAIIESSQGSIWFESEAGEGTTFWFSLPLAGVSPHTGELELHSVKE